MRDLTLIPIILLAVGCSTIQNEQSFLKVTCAQFLENNHLSRNIQVKQGDSILVTLCSNGSTGFQWSESAQISDGDILKQTGHSFIPPETDTPGSAGKEQWTLKPLKDGTSKMILEYSRPWEDGEKGMWSLTATIVVE